MIVDRMLGVLACRGYERRHLNGLSNAGIFLPPATFQLMFIIEEEPSRRCRRRCYDLSSLP